MTEARCSRERCGWCREYSAVGFWVPDGIWAQVVPERSRETVSCLRCFARMADERLIEWDREIEFYPVSLWTHHHDEHSPMERAGNRSKGADTQRAEASHPETLALIEAAERLHDAVERASLAHEVQDEYDALDKALQSYRSANLRGAVGRSRIQDIRRKV